MPQPIFHSSISFCFKMQNQIYVELIVLFGMRKEKTISFWEHEMINTQGAYQFVIEI